MSDISSSSDTSIASAINTNGSPSKPSIDKNNLRLNFEPTNFPAIDGDGKAVAVAPVEKPVVKASPITEMKIPPSVSTSSLRNVSSASKPNLMLSQGARRLPTSVSTSQIDKFRVDSGLQGSSGKLKISPELTFDFTAEDLEDEGEIGRGAYGTVQKMVHKKSQSLIAVKRIRCTVDEREQKKLMMDLEVVMKSNSCPFIVQFFGAVFKEGDCWICMELMDASLDKFYKYVYRKMNQRMPENIIGKIALATVQALTYLKDQLKIIHRDVKPSNILLDREGNIKLCDFGISGQLVDSIAQSRDAGCRPYMAPERIDPNTLKGYDIRSDVWSLGITLYEISTGKFPYPKWNSIFEQLCQVVQGDPPQLSPSNNGMSFSSEFVTFVNTCLIKDQLQRPKYTRLLQHPFLIRSASEVVDVKGYFSYVFDSMGPCLQQRLEDLTLLDDY